MVLCKACLELLDKLETGNAYLEIRTEPQGRRVYSNVLVAAFPSVDMRAS